jgi:hypothetical protein
MIHDFYTPGRCFSFLDLFDLEKISLQNKTFPYSLNINYKNDMKQNNKNRTVKNYIDFIIIALKIILHFWFKD